MWFCAAAACGWLGNWATNSVNSSAACPSSPARSLASAAANIRSASALREGGAAGVVAAGAAGLDAGAGIGTGASAGAGGGTKGGAGRDSGGTGVARRERIAPSASLSDNLSFAICSLRFLISATRNARCAAEIFDLGHEECLLRVHCLDVAREARDLLRLRVLRVLHVGQRDPGRRRVLGRFSAAAARAAGKRG